ncbi:MAG: aminotransferase class I/II-fold pyridoxal phosphate-dependent enzyme [Spirochaetaceae bacterium]|nr:aminotransferase class I/II-fold pyridoxal phosphate-dependent enzyme [Myxococcales bacterium]MCB9725282.1 aminotransferase class I/II-fold pyridoxal phosphate-dependent enzyme [Spirochaetaceae bacterium]
MHPLRTLFDACDAVGSLARELGVGLLDAEDELLDGRTVRVAGRSLLNFCSCSYLGLEHDERLIEGAVAATRRFGTQFSMSRAFVSAPPYAELEALLEEIAGSPVLVLPTTTLATAAALPSLVEPGDAVLLDQQVHMSVQAVAPTFAQLGIPVTRLPHARLDALEDALREHADSTERVWLLVDGIYSMHGDPVDVEALAWLLDRHPRLHLYVDDAHGTGWTGRFGRGHALDRLAGHDRVVVALSLNKSFAAGGAALVFPNEAWRRRVRHVSAPTNFSGPLQPPMLGAAVASARLHLSDELPRLQSELRARIEHVNRRAAELDLPLLHRERVVPIRFVGVGPQAASTALASALLRDGLLPSCALFPAVPQDRTGIRFGVTRHHTLDDLDRLLEALAEHLPESLSAAGSDRGALDAAFGLKREERAMADED